MESIGLNMLKLLILGVSIFVAKGVHIKQR